MSLAHRIREHLAEHGPSTARQIAAALDVPRQKVIVSIQGLRKRKDSVVTSERHERLGLPHMPEAVYSLCTEAPRPAMSFEPLLAAWR